MRGPLRQALNCRRKASALDPPAGRKREAHDVSRSVSVDGAENIVKKEKRGARVDSASERDASLLSSRKVDALRVQEPVSERTQK
jgi:hypothetical protein